VLWWYQSQTALRRSEYVSDEIMPRSGGGKDARRRVGRIEERTLPPPPDIGETDDIYLHLRAGEFLSVCCYVVVSGQSTCEIMYMGGGGGVRG